MTNKKKSREKLPTWDLSAMYSGPLDPALARTFTKAKKLSQRLSKAYRGKLAKLAKKPEEIRRALALYEEIVSLASEPAQYAMMRFCENSRDAERGAFLESTRHQGNEILKTTVFFSLELGGLPSSVLSFLRQKLPEYRHFLVCLERDHVHTLSEKEEQLVTDKDVTGRQAFLRLFAEERAVASYRLRVGKKEELVSESRLLSQLRDAKVENRRAAAQALSTGLAQEARRLAFIHNTLAQEKYYSDQHRRYRSQEDSRHLENQTCAKDVEAMCEVVEESYPLVARYYRLKAKVMGVKKLYDYDRYAPLSADDRHLTYREGKELVLGAFYGFSGRFGDRAREFFDRNWIHAAETPGKRGGAFCMFISPSQHPLVLINYHGTLNDVFTLAHELGHGVHASEMRAQTYLNYTVPLTVAETASVFAEMLLFNSLRQQKMTQRQRLSLHLSRVEGMFATVFRQVAMFRFEQDLHRVRREKGELSVPEINALWRARQTQMFGGSVTLTPGYDYAWSYISHFIDNPFYVYAYAFGELLTLALWGVYQEEGHGFVEKYHNLLSTGGSKSPEDLVLPFGCQLSQKAFWRKGVNVIEEVVGEVEQMVSRG